MLRISTTDNVVHRYRNTVTNVRVDGTEYEVLWGADGDIEGVFREVQGKSKHHTRCIWHCHKSEPTPGTVSWCAIVSAQGFAVVDLRDLDGLPSEQRRFYRLWIEDQIERTLAVAVAGGEDITDHRVRASIELGAHRTTLADIRRIAETRKNFLRHSTSRPGERPMPMLTARQHRRCVAYHEAGHAVVAHVLGARVTTIIVGANAKECRARDAAGLVFNDLAPGGSIDDATISMSGTPAERKAGFEPPDFTASSDLKLACRSLGAHSVMMSVIRQRAAAIVEANWVAVRRVAAALQRRSRLEGAELNSLLSGLRIERPPPDRIAIPDGADAGTQLFVHNLIYANPRIPMLPGWVEVLIASLCPQLTADAATDLLDQIAGGLKTVLTSPHTCRHYHTRDDITRDIEVVQAISIVIDRLRRRADAKADLTRPKRSSRMAFRYVIRGGRQPEQGGRDGQYTPA